MTKTYCARTFQGVPLHKCTGGRFCAGACKGSLICTIHGEELIETHPADAENGPHPDDQYNELVCPDCMNEESAAAQGEMM